MRAKGASHGKEIHQSSGGSCSPSAWARPRWPAAPQAEAEESGGDPTEITMLVLGDKPTNGRLEAMLEKLNERLVDQVNAKLDLFYVEWADWQTQYNLQLLSGDDNVDLITTATDWLFAWENAEKGAFLPLSEEMLQEHAPKTWAQVDGDGHWDLTKLDDGQIYFIPEDNFTQYTNHGFFYRGDWATEAGFENGEITKFEDFTTVLPVGQGQQARGIPVGRRAATPTPTSPATSRATPTSRRSSRSAPGTTTRSRRPKTTRTP